MPLRYVSERGYCYSQRPSGKIIRVPKDIVTNKSEHALRVGDTVTIIIKPYHAKKYITGKVARILTKKLIHTRGRKVKLVTGEVGRIVT